MSKNSEECQKCQVSMNNLISSWLYKKIKKIEHFTSRIRFLTLKKKKRCLQFYKKEMNKIRMRKDKLDNKFIKVTKINFGMAHKCHS